MSRMITRVLALSLFVFAPLAGAASGHAGHGAAATKASSCNDPEAPAALECGLGPTATFDQKGRLWVAWALNGHVYLSRSEDKGASYSSPLPVNRSPERVAADGENRPKVIVGPQGRVYVSWTKRLPRPYTGDVRFAYSADDGDTFSEPVTVNDNRDITSHRFESMGINDKGELFLAWLDKRDMVAAKKSGEEYRGAALYYTLSSDGGISFRPNRKLADHTCECCRTAMAIDGEGNPVIVWRHVFEGSIRDHAIVRLSGSEPGAMQRLSFDQWQVDACPHHGPAIDIAGNGSYHTAWFNNASERHGLFYARSAGGDGGFNEPMSFGRYDAGASHPAVLTLDGQVYLAWKEFDGRKTEAYVMHSEDRGESWSAPAAYAETEGDSDHPFLISDGQRAYLAWHRRGLPYRPIALPAGGQ